VRPLSGAGDIGDSVALMVTDGVVGEIGSVRKYDPINPCDIAPLDRAPQTPALFRAMDFTQAMVVDMPEQLLPMTFHQRQYKWPDEGVGPVGLAGYPPGLSKPPVEVAVGQTVWPLPAVKSRPIFAMEQIKPATMNPSLDTESMIPQRGMSLRPTWTVYKTMPWVPTAFIRNVQLEGESSRWLIEGVTRDSTGTALGNCRVVAMRSDKIAINQDIQANPVVADLTSDGSGNFSAQVGANVPHQLTGYKAGSPDVAGVTVNNVMPVAK